MQDSGNNILRPYLLFNKTFIIIKLYYFDDWNVISTWCHKYLTPNIVIRQVGKYFLFKN